MTDFDTDDPFGTKKKAKMAGNFDDQPIGGNKKLQLQMWDMYPPGQDEPTATSTSAATEDVLVTDVKKAVRPKPTLRSKATPAAASSTSTDTDTPAEEKKAEKKERPRFQRPAKPNIQKDDTDDIVIAAPARKPEDVIVAAPTRKPEVNPDPTTAPDTTASTPSKPTINPSADSLTSPFARRSSIARTPPSAAPAPTSTAPASSTSSAAPFDESDPFGTKKKLAMDESDPFGTKKKQAFNEDAPMGMTAAARAAQQAMLNEQPDDSSMDAAPVRPKPALKPRTKPAAAKKPVKKSSDDAPATPFNEDAPLKSSSATFDPFASDDPFGTGKKNAAMRFDDAPLSGSTSTAPAPERPLSSSTAKLSAQLDALAMTDTPDAGGAIESFSGSLEDRLVHKNWKARSQAYDEMKAIVDATDSKASPEEFSRFAPFIPKMLKDVSAPAFDKALDAICVWCDHGADVTSLISDIMDGVMKKGFTGRPATKSKSDEIVMLLIELGHAEPVMTELIKGTTDKNWKIVQACTQIMIDALSAYGPHVIQIPTVQKPLPKLFAHTNDAVRKAAMDLGCEIYKWMGQIFVQHLTSLKIRSAQEKELQDMFANIPTGQARPTKSLRSAQAAKGGKGGKAAASNEPFDPLSLLKPVDICAKLSKGWNEKVHAPKWQDKKERLSELLQLAESTPKIEISASMHEVVASFKKLLKDTNIVVIAEVVKCILAIAKGSRKAFNPFAKQLLPSLLPFLKEKKITVNKPVNDTLDVFMEHCLDLSECLDAIIESCNDKVQQQRAQTCAWILRTLKLPKQNAKELNIIAKPLGDVLFKTMNDADGEVRDLALQACAELIAIVSRKPFTALLSVCQTKEPKRYQKLEQLINENDRSGAGAGAAAGGETKQVDDDVMEEKKVPSRAASRPGTASGRRPSAIETADDEEAPKPAAKPKPKRPATAAPKADDEKTPSSRPSTAKPSATVKTVTAKDLKIENFTPDAGMSPEEAMSIISAIIPNDLITQFGSKKWNESVAALNEFADKMLELSGAEIQSNIDAAYYTLNHTPTFKPNNFQVCKTVYEVAAKLSRAATNFPKKLAYLPLSDIISKMSDRKVSDAGADLMTAFCEGCGPRFVLGQVMKQTSGEFKNVKALETITQWIASTLSEFGLGTVDVQTVIESTKLWLQSSNKAVRDGATTIFVSIYKQSGNLMKEMMLGGLKPALASTIEAEFAKIPSDEVGKVTATRVAKGEEGKATAALDDLIPRTDISTKITEKLLKKLDEDDWKLRKEGLEEVDAILKAANHRIGPKDGGLCDAMKARLLDKNKNLARDTLVLMATLCTDMGRDISKYGGKMLPALLTNVSDSKKLVKDEAVKSVDVWVDTCGFGSIIKYLPKALTQPSGRKELLDMMDRKLSQGPMKGEGRFELDEIIAPTLACLQDKTSDVRIASEKVLTHICRSMGFAAIRDGTQNMSKATLLQIQPFLDKLRNMSDEDDTPAPTQSAPAAAKKKSVAPATKRPSTAAPTSSKAAEKEEKLERPATAARSGSTKGKSSSSSSSESKSKDLPQTSTGAITRIDLAARKQRIARDAKRVKGSFREWGSDEIDEMSETLRTFTSDAFHTLLFHKDFQKQVAAMDVLDEELMNNYDGVVSLVDVWFKYMAWRMCDANTSVLIKILDFTQKLIKQLEAHDYKISDAEASNFLPFLIEKVLGHNHTKFRTDTRDIIISMAGIYPVSKVFENLRVGYASKNKRVQAECLEESGNMLARYGLTICADKKAVLNEMGIAVGASDGAVRAAALSALQAVYKLVGSDAFWSMLGRGDKTCKVPPKQITMIEERLKRVKLEDTGMTPIATPAVVETDSGTSSGKATPRKSAPTRPSVGAKVTPARAKSAGARASAAAAPADEDADMYDNYEDGEGVDADVNIRRSTTRPQTSGPVVARARAPVPTFEATSTATSTSEAGLPDCFSMDDMPGFSATTTTAPIMSRPVSLSQTVPASTNVMSTPSRPTSHSVTATPTSSLTAASPAPAPVAASPSAPSVPWDPSSMPLLLKQLQLTKEDDRIDAMKQIWQAISSHGALVVASGYEDELVQRLMKQVELSFSERTDGDVNIHHRLCRFALNTMMELFKVETVARQVLSNTLELVAKQLLSRLLDERLRKKTDCRGLVLGLNVLTLKVLENSDRTSSFHVLLKFLRQSVADPAPGTRAFLDLVVKCLLKLTKLLPRDGVATINLQLILRDMYDFMVAHPPNTFKDTDDMPFKAMRTLLSEIVKIKGEEIRSYLGEIPSQSLLHVDIEKMIAYNREKQKKEMGSTTPTQATATMAATPATSATVASATPSTASTPTSSTSAPIDDSPHAATLRDIFTRLHSKAATDQALIDLYTFTRNNPTVSIEPYLARTSTIFRGYIQRGLQRIEKEQMTPRGVNVRAVTATPAATTTITATTPVTTTATTPASSEDPTSVTSNYRERLKQLQSKARSMTAESSVSTVTPVSTSTPATVAPVTAATAPVPQARATPSLDEIRARFRSAKVEPGQENKHVALPTHPNQNTTTNGDVTKPNGAAAAAVSTPATTTAPLSASVSSLDSIRARIAIMKQK